MPRRSALGQRSNGNPLLPLDHVGDRSVDHDWRWLVSYAEEVTSPHLRDVLAQHRNLTGTSHRDAGGQAKACATSVFALEHDVIVSGVKGWEQGSGLQVASGIHHTLSEDRLVALVDALVMLRR